MDRWYQPIWAPRSAVLLPSVAELSTPDVSKESIAFALNCLGEVEEDSVFLGLLNPRKLRSYLPVKRLEPSAFVLSVTAQKTGILNINKVENSNLTYLQLFFLKKETTAKFLLPHTEMLWPEWNKDDMLSGIRNTYEDCCQRVWWYDLKGQFTSTKLHGVTNPKRAVFKGTVVRTSNFYYRYQISFSDHLNLK